MLFLQSTSGDYFYPFFPQTSITNFCLEEKNPNLLHSTLQAIHFPLRPFITFIKVMPMNNKKLLTRFFRILVLRTRYYILTFSYGLIPVELDNKNTKTIYQCWLLTLKKYLPIAFEFSFIFVWQSLKVQSKENAFLWNDVTHVLKQLWQFQPPGFWSKNFDDFKVCSLFTHSLESWCKQNKTGTELILFTNDCS